MILITGATGTNGRLVVQSLLRRGARVRAMVQDAGKAADLGQAGAELVVGDFDRPETLREALSGTDRALLLSAVDPRLVEREGRFVEAARKTGLRHLVKFSAIGAHPAAPFTFGRQHGDGEHLVMASGIAFTFVQPNFFMQNLLWSADTIKAQGALFSTLGAARVSHVDARDIAEVIATALAEPIDRHAGLIHLVTGPAAVTFTEIAETFTRVLGAAVRHADLTDEALKDGLRSSGQPEWQATALVELNRYARHGHASVVTDTVRRVTGHPAIPLEQWVRDHAAAFEARH